MLLDHIDLRVRDISDARPLYDALLSAMGFLPQGDDDCVGYHVPDVVDDEGFIWLQQDPSHVPNATRIAFHASTRAEVDRWAEVARVAGARAFEPPHLCREYSNGYYASFFEDASGNKLEICCRLSR